MLKFYVQKRSPGAEQPRAKTILVVGSDARMSAFLGEAITQRTSYTTISAKDFLWASEIMRVIKPDLILFDAHVLETDNIPLFDHFQSTRESEAITALIFQTTDAQLPPNNEQQRRLGPYLCLPFELEALLQAIEHVVPQTLPQNP